MREKESLVRLWEKDDVHINVPIGVRKGEFTIDQGRRYTYPQKLKEA